MWLCICVCTFNFQQLTTISAPHHFSTVQYKTLLVKRFANKDCRKFSGKNFDELKSICNTIQVMSHVFKCQLMYVYAYNHARNNAHSIQWKTKVLRQRGPTVLQEIGLVLHVQYIVIDYQLIIVYPHQWKEGSLICRYFCLNVCISAAQQALI